MSKFAGNNLLLYPKGSTVCQNRTEEKGHGLPLSHLWNAFTHDRRENTGAPAFQLPKHFFGVLDKSFLPLSCLLTKSTDAKMQRKRRWTLISCRCWIEAQWCDTVTTTYHLCVRGREKSVFAVLHFSFVRGSVWNQYEQHMSVKFKHVLSSIIMQHQYTKTQISEQEICLSSFPCRITTHPNCNTQHPPKGGALPLLCGSSLLWNAGI